MQARESSDWTSSPLERLLSRTDEAAHAWLAERLVSGDEIDPHRVAALSTGAERPVDVHG